MSFKNCTIVGDGVSYETYHKQDAKRGDKNYSMSRSELVEFGLNPKRWLDGFGLKDDGTKATDWGSVIDCLAMTPEKFDTLFAVAPEMHPGAKGEEKKWTRQANYCKEWEAEREAEGKTVISAGVKSEADSAVNAIKSDADVSEFIQCSRKQVYVTGIWKDKATGIEIPVRVLLDLAPDSKHAVFGKSLGDFKTARNGDPANWARVMDDNSYDVQAALYMDVYCAATKEDRTDWIFALQENIAPFHVVKPMPAMTTEFLQWGRLKYQSALALYAQCLATGVWPSYKPFGLVYGVTQLIAPDTLWTYKQSVGQNPLQNKLEYVPKSDSPDIVP